MAVVPAGGLIGVFTDRGRALLAAGVTLAASGVVLGFVDLTRLGLFTAALPLLAALTTWPHPELKVRREIPGDMLTVGRDSTVRVSLTNIGSRRSAAASARDDVGTDLHPARPVDRDHAAARVHPADPAPRAARFALPALDPGVSVAVEYVVHPLRRGEHPLGPLWATRGDPFGLVGRSRSLADAGVAVAAPIPHPLEGWPATAASGVGEANGRGRTASEQADFTIRGYRLGDDLRRVHWPASAHRGELMVRHESPGAADRVVVVLDPAVVPSSQPGGGRDLGGDALDDAVTALSSVVAHLQAHSVPVSLVTPDLIDAGRRVTELDGPAALRALAVVRAEGPRGGRRPSAAGRPARTSPTLGFAREAAAGAGVLVGAVGSDPASARAFFDARPPGVTALAFVVPGRGGGGSAADVAALGAAGGWRTAVLHPTGRGGDVVAQAWRRLLAAESLR